MAFGILEDYKLEHVPGTAPLSELGTVGLRLDGVASAALKYDPSGEILLVPQPSDSPNDPYNWSSVKKLRFTVAYAWGCGCVGAVGPLLGAAFVPLAAQFNVPLATFISGVNGGLIAAIAAGSLLCNSLAVKYGKRPIYLATSIGLLVSCFWAGASTDFPSLVAARVFQGLCMAPMEALVPASIADVWFVHERGHRSAIFNLGVLGGINLAQPIAGAILEYSSYSVAFYAMGGAFVIQLLLTFFWMPETTYNRKRSMNIDSGDMGFEMTEKNAECSSIHVEFESGVDAMSIKQSERLHSWATELKPYSGYVNSVSLLNTATRPFYMLASPAVLWATILFSVCLSWLVAIAITLSQIFSAPPYNFSVFAVGATNLSSFFASFIATAIAGPLIDGLVRRLSKANKGIFEPEFRLPIMITYPLFTAMGFFGWGQSASAQSPWQVPVILCLSLISFGLQLGTTGIVSYVVDCHCETAGEAFAAMNFVKNIFAFGLNFYMNDWIASAGVRNVFFAIGGITVGVSLLTIPMYIFGKRARSWTYRRNIAG